MELLGKKVKTEEKDIPQNELKFFVDNPRVWSTLKNLGKEPTQDEIFEILSKMDNVKELTKDIRNSGLAEEVIVRKSTNEVIEGNRRLAAYRTLFQEDPERWANISCKIMHNVTDDQVTSLLIKTHIKGKAPWQAFEQAGFMWRLNKENKKTINQLKEQFGLAPPTVKSHIATYEFMLEHNITNPHHFSYYLSLNTNKKIGKLKELERDFDKIIIKKIQSGEIKRAEMIRDDLPTVANAPENIIKDWLNGGIVFNDALKIAKNYGVDKKIYKTLKDFNDWLTSNKTEVFEVTGKEKEQVLWNLGKIQLNLDSIKKRLIP
jgi:hypothetical protein